jgi:glycosyltransferase involved in cell wall biosynthesis
MPASVEGAGRLRVIQLGPFPPPHGGVQTNLVAIRDYLRRFGAHCAVINITRHRKPESDEVYSPRNAWELLRLLLRLPAEVVHLHIGGDFTLRLLGLTLVCACLPRRIAVLTFHSGGYASSPAGKTAHRKTLRGFVFRRLDGIICVNQELAALFHRFGVPRQRIRLIPPHAVTPERPGRTLPPEQQRFFKEHSPRLVSVGLLEPEYDLPLQIEALGKLRQQWPHAGLILIGSGSLQHAIAETIRSRSYAPHILLCGDTPHEITLQAMAQSDLFLRTTHYDGDSISVREALHLGVPVIATDNGMRPPGVHLVPISNLGALVSTAGSLLTSRKGRLDLLPQASPLAPAITGSENLEAVLQFYRDLASPR